MGILDTFDPSCVIGLTLAIVVLVLMLVWFSLDRDSVTIVPKTEPTTTPAEPQTQTQTANEPPALNAWSAIHTGQLIYAPISADERMTPAQATEFISLLDAADHDDPPRKGPRTHCLLCIVETCDQWGIPFDEARTIGTPKLCKKHRRFNLANAG